MQLQLGFWRLSLSVVLAALAFSNGACVPQGDVQEQDGDAEERITDSGVEPRLQTFTDSGPGLARAIADSVATDELVVTRLDDRPPEAVVILRAPPHDQVDSRDVCRVIKVFLDAGWQGDITVNFDAVRVDGTVDTTQYASTRTDGTFVIVKYGGRATSPHDLVRTLEENGRVEGIGIAEFDALASGDAPLPVYELPAS